MIPEWWSWLLTAVGVSGLWAAGSRHGWGWLICLGAQGLWIAYALATEQRGFILASIIYGTIYARNYLKWRKEA